MVKRLKTLSSLYEEDETAWLDAMSELAAERRFEDMDFENLSAYLQSMAISDRRAVFNRLVVLILHLLKWDYQPDRRTSSWRQTILLQRLRLEQFLESRILRRHAEEILDKVYSKAASVAAEETGLRSVKFPRKCPFTLDQVLCKKLVK